MNEKTIAAISVSNRDFPNFEAKLEETARWLELAANQGAELAVLPESMNLYKGDGPGNPEAIAIADAALDDWQEACKTLIDAAVRHRIAVTVPVFVRESGVIFNVWQLVSKTGETLGCYRKMYPTTGELDDQVQPGGAQPLIEWEGLKLGGAICFDTYFEDVVASQAGQGMDLLLIPSLWPGGRQLNHYARTYEIPIVVAYPAWSRIIGIDGRVVAEGGYRNETLRFGLDVPVRVATINFDRATVCMDVSQQLIEQIYRDHGEKVRIEFDQDDCAHYIESRSADLTVDQLLAEYGLQRRRAYLDDCAKLCKAATP